MKQAWVAAIGLVILWIAVPGGGQSPTPDPRKAVTEVDEAFLEDLSRRSFQFFWEQADPGTGIVRDRSRTDGSPSSENHEKVGSIASVGFGLTGMCIAAERGWLPRTDILARVRTTLRTFAEKQPTQHGWFYHWINIRTGEREWNSEVSSIDTALLLGGVLSVRQCFKDQPDIVSLADTIYRRIDFDWMRNGHPTLLSHGWRPETGMIVHRWDAYSEAMILYILGLGSPTHPLPPESWRAWVRPVLEWNGFRFVTHAPPLFLHQFSHAWIDFRAWRDPEPPHDWFANAVTATRANKQYCLSISDRFPGYSDLIWGITASDGREGYRAWGGPPPDPQVDGTVVPCAVAGSLMLDPELTLPALKHMKEKYGDRLYGRYGFADAFHPTADWINPHVIGIDLGITLLSAENLRSGNVWRWFMANPEIQQGMRRAGMVPVSEWKGPPSIDKPPHEYRLVPAPPADEHEAARRRLNELPASLDDRFEPASFTAPNGVTLPYRLLRPQEDGTARPLVVLLHGAGEIGTDNRKQITPFVRAWARDETRKRFPAFVVVPQMPIRSAEYSAPATADVRTSTGTPAAEAALALVDHLLESHPIDRQRIYVMGFSMGASTTWNLIHARPGFFAAAIPIAGVPRGDQAAAVGDTRIWVIHGNRDDVNPSRHARRIYRPLVDAGAHIRFWEMDLLDHQVPAWLALDDAFAAWMWEGEREKNAE
ncbi:MAG TPA: glucoamylase family protein [Vicinamibacterales bacterium]